MDVGASELSLTELFVWCQQMVDQWQSPDTRETRGQATAVHFTHPDTLVRAARAQKDMRVLLPEPQDDHFSWSRGQSHASSALTDENLYTIVTADISHVSRYIFRS